MGGKRRQSGSWRRRAAESRQAAAAIVPQASLTEEEQAGDRRVAEAMTVAWMLSLMAAVVAEVGATVGWFVLAWMGGAKQAPALIGMIPGVLFFVSLVTGSCSLGLGWLVVRLREVAPPRVLRRAGVVIGVLPWLGLVGLSLWQAVAK